MHPVLGLVEDDRAIGLENVVGHLQARATGAVEDVVADLRLTVVESRETVHELDLGVARQRQEFGVDLVVRQQGDALVPLPFGLPHREPHIGVDEVSAGHTLGGVAGLHHPRASRGRNVFRDVHHVVRILELGRGDHANVHAHLRAADQQRAAHVEAGVAEIACNKCTAMSKPMGAC